MNSLFSVRISDFASCVGLFARLANGNCTCKPSLEVVKVEFAPGLVQRIHLWPELTGHWHILLWRWDGQPVGGAQHCRATGIPSGWRQGRSEPVGGQPAQLRLVR